MQKEIDLVLKSAVLIIVICTACYFVFAKYDQANAQIEIIKFTNTQNNQQVKEELDIQME